jgi:hypothetical protein
MKGNILIVSVFVLSGTVNITRGTWEPLETEVRGHLDVTSESLHRLARVCQWCVDNGEGVLRVYGDGWKFSRI